MKLRRKLGAPNVDRDRRGRRVPHVTSVRLRLTLFYAGLLALRQRPRAAGVLRPGSQPPRRHAGRARPPTTRSPRWARSTLVAIVAVLLLAAGGGWLVSGEVLAPLARAIAAQRRFVANASHELRTPMTAIRVGAEVALDDPDATVEDLASRAARDRRGDRGDRPPDDLAARARVRHRRHARRRAGRVVGDRAARPAARRARSTRTWSPRPSAATPRCCSAPPPTWWTTRCATDAPARASRSTLRAGELTVANAGPTHRARRPRAPDRALRAPAPRNRAGDRSGPLDRQGHRRVPPRPPDARRAGRRRPRRPPRAPRRSR